MADNANPKGTQGRQQQNVDDKQRPASELIQSRERPMDDPGRGQGDVLEDELPRDSGDRAGGESGQRGS